MCSKLFLGLLPLVSAVSTGYGTNWTETNSSSPNPSYVCDSLKAKFSNLTFLPTDAGYQNESRG